MPFLPTHLETVLLLVIDGPEKAGKTTLCQTLVRDLGFRYVHWDRPTGTPEGWLNDPKTLRAVRRASAFSARGGNIVWDRSWASDWVYSTLLGNDARVGPVQRECIYRPYADHCIILAGPGGEAQFGIRTPDDQPVDPHTERELYKVYGRRFGWRVIENLHSSDELDYLVALVRQLMGVTHNG